MSTFFTKEPHTPSYASWHQDLRYWGLSGDDEMTVWVALGRVTEAHGCMRFVPGTHRLDLLEHRDTRDDDNNFLTRGQHAVFDVDESRTKPRRLGHGRPTGAVALMHPSSQSRDGAC